MSIWIVYFSKDSLNVYKLISKKTIWKSVCSFQTSVRFGKQHSTITVAINVGNDIAETMDCVFVPP